MFNATQDPMEKQKHYKEIKALEKIKLQTTDYTNLSGRRTELQNLKMQLKELKRRDAISYEKANNNSSKNVQALHLLKFSGRIYFIHLIPS